MKGSLQFMTVSDTLLYQLNCGLKRMCALMGADGQPNGGVPFHWPLSVEPTTDFPKVRNRSIRSPN